MNRYLKPNIIIIRQRFVIILFLYSVNEGMSVVLTDVTVCNKNNWILSQ